MKKFIVFGIGFLLLSCAKKINKTDLYILNGYWEIEKVTFPDGSTKEYKVNTSVDYIEYEAMSGFRKKVQPTLNGTFNATNDAEFFTILEKNGSFEFYYKNSLSEWEEQLLTLSKDNFSISGLDGIIYSYKKYQPINLSK